jgi:hypothetical protein
LKVPEVITILFLIASSAFGVLTPLAPQPDWSRLNAFQETITRRDFLALLDKVYAPGGAWKETIAVEDTAAVIVTKPETPPFVLLRTRARTAKTIPRYWRAGLPRKSQTGLWLADVSIRGIEAGAKMGRWFQIVTLHRLPRRHGATVSNSWRRLESGAEVFLTRRPTPTSLPSGSGYSCSESPSTGEFGIRRPSRRKVSVFYRVAEIRRRAP